MLIEIALAAALHSSAVEMDEQVRYEQLAAIQAAKTEAEAEYREESCQDWYWEPSWDEASFYDDSDGSWDVPYCEPTYYAPYDASDGISAAEFQWMGVVDDDAHFYTWYSERVLPGGGLTELNANGRHSEDGFVKDGDGYIAVASCDYEKGTVIDTPFGAAKVYDTGYLQPGQVDVYTSF